MLIQKEKMLAYILDDDPDVEFLVGHHLTDEEKEKIKFFTFSESFYLALTPEVRVVVVDVRRPDENTTVVDVIRECRKRNPDIYVIIVTQMEMHRQPNGEDFFIDLINMKMADMYLKKRLNYEERLVKEIRIGFEEMYKRDYLMHIMSEMNDRLDSKIKDNENKM